MQSNGSDEKLRKDLSFLEEDYFGQPAYLQKEDLEEINKIRSQLNMPLVDDKLVEIKEEESETESENEIVEEVDPYAEAREIYERYLKKNEELDLHRKYATKIVRATEGSGGKTPVYPLAKMGTDGGPLLCDHCKKPIPLEGGSYHGKPAPVAWEQRSNPSENWVSWILHGLIVEVQTNGTLRIYHGYPNQPHSCYGKALAADEKARTEHDDNKESIDKKQLSEFIRNQFPEMDKKEQRSLYNEILNTLYFYDPGIGVNRP